MASPTQSVDPAVIEQKIGIAFGAVGGVVTAGMIHLGNKLGLYRALAGAGPLTSAQLATRAGAAERFVREWLLQQAASGIVESCGDDTFELGPESAMVFADANNPAS